MKSLRLVAPLAALLTANAIAVGPTSTLYVMNYGEFSGGNETGLDLIQGATENSFGTGYLVDICIGTYGDVRTMGYSGGDKGDKFNLTGSPVVGGPYLNSVANSQLHDGTSDGKFNYAVDYTTGLLLQFDRNWANSTVLFNAGFLLTGAGFITMNAADGSFWISQWGGGDKVIHTTHGGTLLSSFNSGLVANQGLALDAVDGTLWMNDPSLSHSLYQYDQSGNQLQSMSFSLQGQWYGMEFDTTPVPEPATLGLLSMGALAIIKRRSYSK